MLITKTTKVKWNSKNKKHYVDLGYVFTRMRDEFEVNVQDLTNGSDSKVIYSCDYCNELVEVNWFNYNRSHKEINKDCCSNPKCTGLKSNEVIQNKYNVDSVWHLDFVKNKTIETNNDKYGCDNPFANKDIQEKIKKTNLIKYGCEYSLQNYEVIKKGKQTCLEKYGVENYGKLYSESHIKEASPSWKGGVSSSREERASHEYRDWRKQVFFNDKYTCQCCGLKNGLGTTVELEAHHIINWSNNPDLRYDISNGITLCKLCHKKFHSTYGKKNNNTLQINEFIKKYNIDEKIC